MVVNAMPCPFCAIVHGTDGHAKVVFRNGGVTAFLPLTPATRGHVLVVPNRHVADLTELTHAEGRELGEAIHRTARAARSALAPDGMNVIQSTGEAATQSVPHVHFHVLPRWHGDRMVLKWPHEAAENEDAQRFTLVELRAALTPPDPGVSAEDRRQHLAFIQAAVTRMSQASSSSKSWLLPIVTLTYGYAVTKDEPAVALLGVFAAVVFGFLDANYLKQERAFRRLYDEVSRGGALPAFAMNPTLALSTAERSNYWPDWRDIRSWAVAPVYGSLLTVGFAIVAWSLFA